MNNIHYIHVKVVYASKVPRMQRELEIAHNIKEVEKKTITGKVLDSELDQNANAFIIAFINAFEKFSKYKRVKENV